MVAVLKEMRMGIEIKLNLASHIPLYMQIVYQVRRAVGIGNLRPGDRLPVVRVLAEGLGLNPNTIGRAFKELRDQGFIVTRGYLGTFVADDVTPVIRERRKYEVYGRINQMVEEIRHLGMPLTDVVEVLQKHLNQLRREAGMEECKC
jgi:GntR family transcriptional regulator